MDNPLILFLQLFGSLTQLHQEVIAAAFEKKEFKEGDILFEGGKVCNKLFFICEGVLRIMKDDGSGWPVTYLFLKENQFCTILNSFNNSVAAEESIVAACNTAVLVISKNKLLQLYEQLPFLKELINQIMQQALIDKIELKNAYLGIDSTTRYQVFITRQPDIALRVSLTDVASYLGVTPQSLSRIRKNLR